MAPHFILEALNVDFQLITVDRKSNAQKSDDYLALNPAGRIPTLIDDKFCKGFTLFESPAICIHLAETNPSANLIPKAGEPNRSLFFQWMMYLTNTLQAELMIYCYPQKHTTDIKATNGILEAQEARLTDMLELLDRELAHKKFLIGDTITACDYFLFMLAIWADEFKRPPLSFNHLGNYLCRLAQRDEIVKVCETEQLNLSDYQCN
jgi:glutathione S-transferase